MIDFKDKLSRARPLRRQRAQPGQWELADLIEDLESDRGRIINSAAIRRLQQKTQVFPLERNAAVRSRLTHSLEVQQVGRFLVRMLYRELGDDAKKYGLDNLQDVVETVVEMACLMHDVGNPPFGHFGEAAINQWSVEHLPSLFAAQAGADEHPKLVRKMLLDLQNFEGNAQALRLAVKLLRLNLTHSQTAAMLKYVRPAYEGNPKKGSPQAYLRKKPGFYLSEQEDIERLWEGSGLKPHTRHPLAYLMEAADDIAYCLADLEDAVEKGLFSVEALAGYLLEVFSRENDPDEPLRHSGEGEALSFRARVENALQAAKEEDINAVSQFFVRLRVRMIYPMVNHAVHQFIEHLPEVFAGDFDRALIEDGSTAGAIVKTFKQVASEHVFCWHEVETLLLQGHRILHGLLQAYSGLLRISEQEFHGLLHSTNTRYPDLRLLVRRLPSHLLAAYVQAVENNERDSSARLWELYYRVRLLQDYISGMTDQQAQDEYHTLLVV